MNKFSTDRSFYLLGMCLYFVGFLACAYFQFRVLANISTFILHPSFIQWTFSYLVIHLVCTLFTMRYFSHKSYNLALLVAIVYLLSSYYYFYIFLGFITRNATINDLRLSIYLGQAATLVYGITLLSSGARKDLFLKIIGITCILDTTFALISFFRHEAHITGTIGLLYKVVASFVVFIYILFMLTFWKEYKKITGESYSLKFTGISAKAATCLGIISLLALLYFTPKLERESKTLFKILGKTEFKSNNRILSRI